ncbi:Abi family protein [Microbacterium luteolum]|uniref:Abi-like protein n=1 Tax=Microbacterium luteolum TaxID=69367 RepID=A0ABY7XKA4_MICLT|nr:hypothetical protein [Microbacterium luteolum]WDM42536.1 hypothetical protein KV395_04290 [Microbacterium luteolum]
MPVDIVTYLSQPRLSTYVSACGGDEAIALDLYRANAQVSGLAFTSLHYFEVILRNALDAELARWNLSACGRADWTLHAAPLLLAVIGLERLKDARDAAWRAVGRKRSPTHDDVVAQLSLGTWRYMLPSARHQGKQKLWDDAIEQSFPNRHGVSAASIAQSVSIAYDFRNRVAHHEPVFALDLRGKRRAMRDVLNSVGGPARKWFVEHDPLAPGLNDFYAQWPQLERKN